MLSLVTGVYKENPKNCPMIELPASARPETIRRLGFIFFGGGSSSRVR